MPTRKRVQNRKDMGADTLIKELEITEDIATEAAKMSKGMGVLKGSFTKGAGNIYGAMGELIVSKYLNRPIESTYNYDIVLSDGKKVDVKTKRTSVKPKLDYDCSISNWNTKQQCDYYIFCRIKNDFSVGWILGYYDKDQYLEDSIFMKRGTIDKSNGYVVKSDCYNLKISSLKNIDDFMFQDVINQSKENIKNISKSA